MIRTNALLAVSIVFAAMLVPMVGGCKSDSPPPAAADEPASETAVAATAEPESLGAPKIAADEPVFDFGSINPAGRVEHVFKIKNTGTAELKIERVQKT
jgi:hypothetical protein